MTKLAGSMKLQGVTLGATSSILTSVGTDGGTTGGLTIKGGPGPAYTYAAEYEAYATDNYTLTATAVVYAWNTWVGERSGESNFAHTYSFNPSYAISAMTQLGVFQTIGGFNEAVYAEYVVDALSTPLGIPVMQVGVESVAVPGTGYQASYQVYYTNDGTVVQFLDGVDQGSSSAPTYGAGDVIGMVVYRTASTFRITWFKNGVYAQESLTFGNNLVFSRTRVNIGQMATGYPYGPIRHPVPTPTVYATITISSDIADDYVYPVSYVDWYQGRGLAGTYTLVSTEFATGTSATYSNSNRSLTYPAAIAPWPHVTEISTRVHSIGDGTIYEVQNTPGDATTTMLSRVGITATGVDAYFDADYGSGGYGNYNVGDVIGVVITTADDGLSSTIYWFVNGGATPYTSQVIPSALTAWQIYVEFGEDIYRPQPA